MFYSWPCTDSSEQSLRKLTPQSHHLSLDLIYMQRSPVKQRGWCIHVALWNLPQGPVMCLGKRWSHHSVLLTPGFYSQKWDVVVIRLKDEIREGVATIIRWWRLIKWSLPNLKLMMASILLKPPLGGRWPVIYTCNWVSFTWKDKDDSPLLRLRWRAFTCTICFINSWADNSLCQFNFLPFSLFCVSWVFTKTFEANSTLLREQGVRL